MAKVSTSNSIVVDAPIDVAFDKFNNPDVIPDWISTSIQIRNLTPPFGVGTTYETVAKFMGREIVMSNEVVALDVPKLFAFHTEGVFSGDIQHQFEAVDGGIRVTITFEGEASGFFASLATPLIKRQIDRQMKNDLKNFKRFIES